MVRKALILNGKYLQKMLFFCGPPATPEPNPASNNYRAKKTQPEKNRKANNTTQ